MDFRVGSTPILNTPKVLEILCKIGFAANENNGWILFSNPNAWPCLVQPRTRILL
jgi:hypothetical protein